NHFSAPPYQYLEARAPGVRRITTEEEILGGRATFVVAYGTEKFRAENPKTYGAFLAALGRAIVTINADPRAAARIYLEMSKDKLSEDEAFAMITDPGTRFTLAPEKFMS